jgi:Cas6b C-terminal domain/Cas6b N-terminal domain
MNDDTARSGGPVLATLGRFVLAGEPLRGPPQVLAAQWRGAAAARFPDHVAFHGHDGERAVVRYPEVHYRWIEGAPALFAFGEAAHAAMTHPWPGATLRIGDAEQRVVEVRWDTIAVGRTFSRRLLRYELGAPWLALNQQNHERYRSLDAAARRAELDRILVGNLLTMSQAFGGYFEGGETVYAAFEVDRDVRCTVKGVPLVGFEGRFVTNLDLSSGLAIGRSVSHGFGWFRRA